MVIPARVAALAGLLLVVAGCIGRVTDSPAPVDQFAPGRWTTLTPLPAPRQEVAVAAFGDRVWVIGGFGDSADSVSNAHEVYDPDNNRWTRANAMPTARDHLAAVGFQGRVWALGGRASFMGEQYGNVEIYDPATDSWRTGPPLPAARGGLASVALPDPILVFGGEAPLRIFSANEMYEVAGNRRIAKEPKPTPRHGIGAAVLGGRVYVPAGATRPGFAATTANEAYAP